VREGSAEHDLREKKMLLSGCRKVVDTYAPQLGRQYRLLRDATYRRRSIRTKYGFTLAGDPSMTRAEWEADEIEAFLALLRTHDAVLDIGANIGFYSCLAARCGKPAVAFEPSSRNLRFLYRNLSENECSEVEVIPVGLGGHCGLRRMYGFGGISSFVPNWAQARESHSTLVPLTTLDTIVAGRFKNRKLLIKMDVEGFELDVLDGAEKTLNRIPKPTWMVEILLSGAVIPAKVSRTFTETFQVFWKHGYRSNQLDSLLTPVEPADVGRWIADGSVDSGTHDFLFSAD
jgi:FkbM family methyltransferase